MRALLQVASLAALAAGLTLGGACRGEPSREALETLRERAEAGEAPASPREYAVQQASHGGPPVARGTTGPARFVAELSRGFDVERAMELARFADGFYREPGNDGFEAVLDRLAKELEGAGYGRTDGFLFETLVTPLSKPAWTPLGARIVLRTGGSERTLLEFQAPGDAARTMLPRNAPSAEVEGELAFALEGARPGVVLVLAEPLRGAELTRAKDAGVRAVLSAGIEAYNVDPSGRERHRDALQYSSVPYPCPLPVARISERVLETLRSAHATDPAVRVRFEARVRFDERPLRTLIATVRGAARPEEAVVVAAHVQEPGACDNASGVAALAECARSIAAMIEGGRLARPARSLAFVFGLEHTETRLFLEHTPMRVIAGLSADMLGESGPLTGGVALLERTPDPGAVRPLAPDQHTAWGSRPVARDEIVPSGLAVVARCALLDVGEACAPGAPAWTTNEHPYEGGSDHDELLRKGIPGVLFWHFPDFAYHTSLDRMEHVDPLELARSATAVASCALALADAGPADLERYLASLRLELDVRLAAANAAEDSELAALWREWSIGARQWLRRLCLPAAADAAPTSPPAPR